MAYGVYNTTRWCYSVAFNRALSCILKGEESYYDLVIPSVEPRKVDDLYTLYNKVHGSITGGEKS